MRCCAGIWSGIKALVRDALSTEPHPAAHRIAKAADQIERSSANLEETADEFSKMIRGMRGQGARKRRKSGRA